MKTKFPGYDAPLPKGLYRSRSAAVRGARRACRVALNAPHFSAYEPHDFLICTENHPDVLFDAYRFLLRGPAAEAAAQQ